MREVGFAETHARRRPTEDRRCEYVQAKPAPHAIVALTVLRARSVRPPSDCRRQPRRAVRLALLDTPPQAPPDQHRQPTRRIRVAACPSIDHHPVFIGPTRGLSIGAHVHAFAANRLTTPAMRFAVDRHAALKTDPHPT